MRQIAAKYSPQTRNLSVSFRCKSEIVKNAQWRVPDFKWHKEGGRVNSLASLDLRSIVDSSAIICRNNAPLFRLALNLLSSERPCRVAGSDVGPKLVNTLKRLAAGNEGMARSTVLAAIDNWAAHKDTASA